MSWLTLIVVGFIAAASGAVLLRQPGVALYDWFASRCTLRRTAARASVIPPAPRAPAHAVKHPDAAPATS
ncbi:hypothetical protein HMPREF0004_2853 [Achromobacter piechaudii ATCC 43553]|uniref:Uncharacterized protein n=2 Tax=Achromobacter piechaudii TaxID=72556 RepID=D4XBK6_9BURK|nr:hypothetical protein HMPREF0004_2853 [Achromobacter piechaudii ATCC 43553]